MDAEAGQGLVLALDRPVADAQPEGARFGIAGLGAGDQLLREVVALVEVMGDGRVLGGDVLWRPLLGDIAGVEPADEAVALFARLLRGLAVGVADVARHRLAHRAAGVADVALAQDLGAGGREGAGDGVAEGDVAQVPGVQGLGRVGVAEVDDDAAAGAEVGGGESGGASLLERGACSGDPLLRETDEKAPLGMFDLGDRGGDGQGLGAGLGRLVL